MLRTITLVLTLSAALPLAAQPCLSVERKSVTPIAKETGAGKVKWEVEVEVENHCKLPQMALLTIDFTAAGGDSLYQVREQSVIGRLDTETLGRSVYVPARYIDRIESLEVELKERERPM